MAQSPIVIGQDPEVSPAQGRYVGATIVMNPRVEEAERKSAESPQPVQVSEMVSMPCSAVETGQESDEPSIEEYMAALLARTRQFSVSPTRDVQPLVRPPIEPRKPSAASTVSPSPSPPPASPAPAPECRGAISELRELANISARSSLNTHRAQRLALEMRGKRLVAAIAVIVSVVLLSLASSVRSPAYIAAVAAVITACAFSLRYLSLGRELAQLCADSDLNNRAED
jgi:hypothetical protein